MAGHIYTEKKWAEMRRINLRRFTEHVMARCEVCQRILNSDGTCPNREEGKHA